MPSLSFHNSALWVTKERIRNVHITGNCKFQPSSSFLIPDSKLTLHASILADRWLYIRANCLMNGQGRGFWPLNTAIFATMSLFLLSMLKFGNLFEKFSLKTEIFPYVFVPSQPCKWIYFHLSVSQLGTQHGGKIVVFFLWLAVGFLPVSIKNLHIYVLQILISEREKKRRKAVNITREDRDGRETLLIS